MVKKYIWLELVILVLGVLALVAEQILPGAAVYLYLAAFAFMILIFILKLSATEFKKYYIRRSMVPLIIIVVGVVLFVIRLTAGGQAGRPTAQPIVKSIGVILPVVLILQQIVVLLDISRRLKKMDTFLQELFLHPARTILVSFFMVILMGTMLLQLPVATVASGGLRFLDAFFTSTSAVCVTGLIVVDTATVFTLFGHLVILGLIQVGGLSIIILSFFVIFVLRKRISLESKILISYVLSEDDVNSISGSIKRIIFITLSFELAGAVLLFFRFYFDFADAGRAVLFSVFHAISAFCNAGFALFTNSLENYVSSPYVTFIISVLIIAGGLSFAVFVNLFENISDRIASRRKQRRQFIRKLTVNTKIVLGVSAALLISGMFLFYALEHGKVLQDYGTGTQYLAAFFQSVTLRTAGFNTVPFNSFGTATLLIMIIYMFIGGSSGSTAGGIKVNTITAIVAWVKSAIKREDHVTIFKNRIKKEVVMRGILIMFFGLGAVIVGTIVLSLSESAPLERILFETVSAFGTVGLSTGITGSLSALGKTVIIILMFIGRTGPLTILAAMNERDQNVKFEYPYSDILIG